MSSFDNQRAPNVSEFIANLNAIPSAQDLASQQDYNFDDDLAMFTNTTFFDFDLGQSADLQPQADLHFNEDAAQYGQQTVEPLEAPDMAKANMDFLQGDFTFPDFSSFSHQHAEAYPVDAAGLMPLNTSHTGLYNNGTDSTTSPQTSDLASPSQSNDRKRSADAMLEGAGHGPYGSISSASGQAGSGFEDASRLAAEEDKRRRNTAASARFRVKKKQREQALEKSAKEMSDKVAALEGRINQLETENKWLKNLVMEKNDDKEDLAALWKKFSQENADRRAANAAAKAKAEANGAGVVVAKKEVQA